MLVIHKACLRHVFLASASMMLMHGCGGGDVIEVQAPTPLGPVFATAQAAGAFQASLQCSTTASGPTKVSFGLPFPRGFLGSAQNVRIETLQGQEMASDNTELARWRHLGNTAIDGQFIRSVLVSLTHNCEAGKAYDIVVRWGSPKTLSANLGITPANVSDTWGPQAAPLPGEHTATDDYSHDTLAKLVLEPRAWVALPAAWLMKSNIRGPVSPVTDPVMKDALIGFNKTYVNDTNTDVTQYEVEGVSGGLIDWNTEYEGWLFDRPFAIWNMYVQTGDQAWLRHAHRASQYYASWIAADASAGYAPGAFRKKPQSWSGDTGDAKYSHAGGLFAAYLLTGDARLLDTIKAIAAFAPTAVQFRLYPYERTSGLWTERHLAAGLAAAVYAYEATGDAAYATQVRSIIDGMQADVDKPPAGYPSATDMRGVLLHRPEVHEGDSTPDMIMSPWLSALLSDVLMHYYLLSDDPRALKFMANYAQFVVDKGLYFGKDIQQTVPWYIAGLKAGYTDSGEWDDVLHTPDILGLLARGRWARSQLGLPVDALDAAIVKLREGTRYALADAIRSTAGQPNYRATPTRRVGWWFGTNESLAWFGVQ